MTADNSPRPQEADVHLSIFLHGLRLDFRACVTAASVFVQEWRDKHWHDPVQVCTDDASQYPRLPCERLYLQSR
ncbi:hypothetical protein OHA40_25775 [Nocardia sp. NBC_00508]|uniref:hypothetical protein n=1 Tax=Nocardia sp. NBC_00508 TaxID=2975992 RepID=UPI002E7FC4B9|nr:hypothetical protein [Nocardia sp. NBC_00508]WUD65044.1 hypothetical protein OHA40_25775 [Nocardia sp. NBC_00508]